MVNRAAATLARSAATVSGGRFPLHTVRATEGRPEAYVGSDAPAAMEAEFGGIDTPPTPWVLPSLEHAGLALGGGHE